MILVVDDRLLLTALTGDPSPELVEAMVAGDLFTTSSWYFRLARASQDRGFSGALSSAIEALAPAEKRAVLTGLDALPDLIGVVGARRLVPVMARLHLARRPNFLTAEAVASALLLGGGIRVTTESPLLTDACAALSIEVRVVDL